MVTVVLSQEVTSTHTSTSTHYIIMQANPHWEITSNFSLKGSWATATERLDIIGSTKLTNAVSLVQGMHLTRVLLTACSGTTHTG